MLRFLLAPRRVVLHLVAIALVAAMTALGYWQLQRAMASKEPTPAADPGPVPLSRVTTPGQLLPGQAYGRRVTVAGTFDARRETLVAGGERPGGRGYWVLTPLRVDERPAVAVVRGRTVSRQGVPPPQPGTVRVTGRVYPSGALGSEGTQGAAAMRTSQLAGRLPYRLADGFVVATRQRPPAGGELQPVPASPWPRAAGGFPLQNSAYAVQWWLFALFVGFMWWRVLRDQWHQRVCKPQQATG